MVAADKDDDILGPCPFRHCLRCAEDLSLAPIKGSWGIVKCKSGDGMRFPSRLIPHLAGLRAALTRLLQTAEKCK